MKLGYFLLVASVSPVAIVSFLCWRRRLRMTPEQRQREDAEFDFHYYEYLG